MPIIGKDSHKILCVKIITLEEPGTRQTYDLYANIELEMSYLIDPICLILYIFMYEPGLLEQLLHGLDRIYQNKYVIFEKSSMTPVQLYYGVNKS